MRRLALPALATPVLAALVLLDLSGAAQAGLLPPLPSLDQPGNLDDSDSGANWYLRGTLGMNLPASPLGAALCAAWHRN